MPKICGKQIWAAAALTCRWVHLNVAFLCSLANSFSQRTICKSPCTCPSWTHLGHVHCAHSLPHFVGFGRPWQKQWDSTMVRKDPLFSDPFLTPKWAAAQTSAPQQFNQFNPEQMVMHCCSTREYWVGTAENNYVALVFTETARARHYWTFKETAVSRELRDLKFDAWL